MRKSRTGGPNHESWEQGRVREGEPNDAETAISGQKTSGLSKILNATFEASQMMEVVSFVEFDIYRASTFEAFQMMEVVFFVEFDISRIDIRVSIK